MARFVLVTLLAAALLVAPAPAAAARTLSQLPPTIQELFDNGVLRPFVNKILSVPACIADPALSTFDSKQCPGLYAMLDALSLGNANPPADCELSCAREFYKLSEDCTGGLRALFGDELSDLGRVGTEFFVSCDEVLPPMGRFDGADSGADGGADAPAPAPSA